MKRLIRSAVANDKGRVRANNEDNYCFHGHWIPLDAMNQSTMRKRASRKGQQFFAVCDGMGGEAAGETASYTAARALAEAQRRYAGALTDAQLTAELRQISDQIDRLSRQKGARSGTTYVGCQWRGGTVTISSVGDSRAYRLSDGRLTQLTTDQSEVQRLLSMGLISSEEAKTHPRRHVISQYLGIASAEGQLSPVFLPPIPVKDGDRIVLCSDGLTDMVDDDEIEEVLQTTHSAADAANQLLTKAMNNGGRDNVTVLVVDLGQSPPPWNAGQITLLAGGALSALASLLLLAEWLMRLL